MQLCLVQRLRVFVGLGGLCEQGREALLVTGPDDRCDGCDESERHRADDRGGGATAGSALRYEPCPGKDGQSADDDRRPAPEA